MDKGAFVFENYRFDPHTGALRLSYAYESGPAFEEIITFKPPFAAYDAEVLDQLFRLLFLLAGVSYYKAYVPEKLICKAFPLDAALAAFVTKVYTLGLGEFAHKNGLNLREKIHFESVIASGAKQSMDRHAASTAGGLPARHLRQLAMTKRVLVPVGGGKDSTVTFEALKKAGMDVTLFAMTRPSGPAAPTADTIALSGLPSVFVTRALSPNIFELNKTPGVYNGHIPVTAILSTVAVAVSVLYGFGAVVMSNERSANAPNFGDVNHQYSKSFEFERDFSAYLASHISPDLRYFSFLRPLSEIAIAQRFAKLEAYHPVFRSCNTAFKEDELARGKKWCCNCPKCRFVFLALAPFLSPAKMVAIFGQNLLDDPSQIEGFAELCGLSNHKPFECVGEIHESAAAMKKISDDPVWKSAAVVAALAPRIGDIDFEALFDFDSEHAVPPEFMEILRC